MARPLAGALHDAMEIPCPCCPDCGSAATERRTGTHTYEFQGQAVTIQGVEFCQCPHCGRQITNEDQDERNRERISIRNLEIIGERWSFGPRDE